MHIGDCLLHIQGMDIAVPANVAEIVLFVERNGDVL